MKRKSSGHFDYLVDFSIILCGAMGLGECAPEAGVVACDGDNARQAAHQMIGGVVGQQAAHLLHVAGTEAGAMSQAPGDEAGSLGRGQRISR